MRYVGISDYASQLAAYRKVFPPQNLLVLISERFRADKIATLRQVEAFLGLDPAPDIEASEKNVTSQTIRPLRIAPEKLYRWKSTRLWQRVSQILPEGLKDLARKGVYRQQRPQATRADVPDCVVKFLAERAREFRIMIGDDIPEWNL